MQKKLVACAAGNGRIFRPALLPYKQQHTYSSIPCSSSLFYNQHESKLFSCFKQRFYTTAPPPSLVLTNVEELKQPFEAPTGDNTMATGDDEDLIDPPLEDEDAIAAKKEQSMCNFTGMRVAFLGTASNKPTKGRNVSSIALQTYPYTLLFDCGEGTQTQIMKSPEISISDIAQIFITHMHGDHVRNNN